MDPVWHVPVAHTIIQLSIALLSLIIGTWLAQESRLNRHPALPVLSSGFFGMAVIAGLACGIHNSNHLLVIRTISLLWTMGYGGFAVILLNWQPMRRYFRQLWLERSIIFYSLPVAVLSSLALAVLWLDQPLFHSAARATTVRAITFV